MKRRHAGAILVVGALTAGLVAPGAGATPVARSALTTDEATSLGKQAYDYGLPLLEFLRVRAEETSVRCPDGRGNAPVNSFSNAAGFATANDRTVVAPNTDTLYSIAHLDLARGPIVLSHPDMGKRYYSFELLDPYTNVIDIRGARKDGGAAGASRSAGTMQPGGPSAPLARRLIKSKYRRVWVIGRTLATEPGRPAQGAEAHGPVPARPASAERPGTFPKGCEPGAPRDYTTPKDGPSFIAALDAALKRNPPPKRDAPLLSQLRPLGIGAGLSPERAGLPTDVLAALYDGVAQEAASLPGSTRLMFFTQSKLSAGLAAAQVEHRRLRHRLPLPSSDRGGGARGQHAQGGDLPDGHHRRHGGALQRRQPLPAHLPARPGAAGAVLLVADHVRQ